MAAHITSSGWKKPRRLYEELARHLARAIARGEYQPEDFLPTEQTLAQDFGASRTVVREALKMLGARGMVEAVHGRGTRVLPRFRWQLSDQILFLLASEKKDVIWDLMEVRRILETEIAGLAAQRATPEQVGAMRLTIQKESECLDRAEKTIEYDLMFHRLLAESTGNSLLPQVLGVLSGLVRDTAQAAYVSPAAGEIAVARHKDVLDHVVQQDAAGARQAMRRHLLELEKRVRQMAGLDETTPSDVS